MHLTVTPAYGRDYKTVEEARSAWLNGQDFTIATPGYTGRYVGIGDKRFLLDDGYKSVRIRFKALTRFVDVEL